MFIEMSATQDHIGLLLVTHGDLCSSADIVHFPLLLLLLLFLKNINHRTGQSTALAFISTNIDLLLLYIFN